MTATKPAKFTRRHLTARVLTDALAAVHADPAFLAVANGEKLITVDGGNCVYLKLEGCDTHGPCRMGLASDPCDFDAIRAAMQHIERALAHFGNVKVWNQSRSIYVDFSGVVIDASRRENRD